MTFEDGTKRAKVHCKPRVASDLQYSSEKRVHREGCYGSRHVKCDTFQAARKLIRTAGSIGAIASELQLLALAHVIPIFSFCQPVILDSPAFSTPWLTFQPIKQESNF